MSNSDALIVQKDCGEFLKDNYFSYGNYINFNRVLPGIDGLKPVHRRILMALNEISAGKLTSSINAIGATQSKYHPFGDKSLEGSLAELARMGIIDSKGDFGVKLVENVTPAAPRYTKVGLSESQNNYFFKLKKYSPEHEGEVDFEKKFLINPVPTCLISGTFAWGLGMTARIPGFTYQSILAAYKADDPTLLKSSFGYKMNTKESELKALWEHGTGKLSLSMNVIRVSDDRIIITGSGERLQPNLGIFNALLDDNQITIQNESTDKITFAIERMKGARKVDMDEVYKMCKRCSTSKRPYNIRVVHEGKIISLGIRDWLNVTMTTFKDSFEQNKTDKVNSNLHRIEILDLIPRVAELLKEDKSSEEIAKALDVKLDHVKEVEGKTLRMLRKKSFDTEIDAIHRRIKEIKSESSDVFIDDNIETFAGICS